MSGLQKEGILFQGLLFPGLMITDEGPKVLEFNCRFGDPETQVILPRLKTDLVELLEAAIDGALDRVKPVWENHAAVCVIMASESYPGDYPKGREITGLKKFEGSSDTIIFHAGTQMKNGKTVTSGGRVLGVTGLGKSVAAARDKAYEAVTQIEFEGAHHRTDIAVKGLD